MLQVQAFALRGKRVTALKPNLFDMTRDHEFKGGFTRLWWIPFLTGLLGLAVGVWCLCSPRTSLPALACFFTGCLCAAGLLNVCFGIVNANAVPKWGWSVAIGIFELVCGAWLLTLPESVLAGVFVYVIGFCLIAEAIGAICETCAWLNYAKNWTGLLLGFLLIALLLSCMFLSGPAFGGIVGWLYIGFAFVSMGLYRFVFALKLRKLNKALNS